MFCPNCGYNYGDEKSNFCPNCGAPLNQGPVWQDDDSTSSSWNISPNPSYSFHRKKHGCLIASIFIVNLIILVVIFSIAGVFSSESASTITSSLSEQAFSDVSDNTTNPEDNSIPTEYKSALVKAESYAENMHMSKAAIYDQLVSEYGEQFSEDAARYAVNHIDVDWKANALAKAESYQTNFSMSPNAIYDQLISEYGEQFTPEEAQYAIDHLS